MSGERVCMLVRNDCRTDQRVLKEAEALARADYAVTVIAVNTYGPQEEEEKNGFRIVRVPVERASSGFGKAINLFPKAIWRMAQAAAEVRAAVYHAHDSDTILPAGMAARQVRGARLVYDAHELGYLSLRQFLALYPAYHAIPLYAWNCVNDWIVTNRVDEMISTSRPWAELQAKRYRHPLPTLVINCPPKRELKPEKRDCLAERLGVSTQTPIVICQGMFSVQRGDAPALEALIRSAPMLAREAVVAIVGNVATAEQFAYLQQLAGQREYRERVFLVPTVAPETLRIYTSGATIGLISLKLDGLFRYALPNKLFDYLGAGLPVVSGDLPPVQEICEEYGCGLACDASSAQSTANAINRILEDPVLYQAMQAGAIRAAEVYNWEEQERRLVGLYARMVQAEEPLRRG